MWVKESVCERERGGRRTGKQMASERRKMGHLRMMLKFAIRDVIINSYYEQEYFRSHHGNVLQCNLSIISSQK